MKTIDKNGEAHTNFGGWGTQPEQLVEISSQVMDAELKFETTDEEEEQLNKMETRLNKKHEDVINMLRKRLHKKFRLSRLSGIRSI